MRKLIVIFTVAAFLPVPSLADSLLGVWETQVTRPGTQTMRLLLDIGAARVTWSTECVLDDGTPTSDSVSTRAEIGADTILIVERNGRMGEPRNACELGIIEKGLRYKLEPTSLVVTDAVGTIRRFKRAAASPKLTVRRPIGAFE